MRVASKPSIRTWSNSRGEGRVLNVDLVDETVSACVSVSALSLQLNLFPTQYEYNVSALVYLLLTWYVSCVVSLSHTG